MWLRFRGRNVYVGAMRGATAWEWQVWKLYGGFPYWRFMKCGCWPYIRWDDYDYKFDEDFVRKHGYAPFEAIDDYGTHFDENGTLRNKDGTRSIFDDVDK